MDTRFSFTADGSFSMMGFIEEKKKEAIDGDVD
jgi:hypothetical protein